MAQIAVDSDSYKVKTEKVKHLVSEVAEAKSDLGSKEDNLRVSGVSQIYKIYDRMISLMKSYGGMAHHDVGEFDRLGVKIKEMDEEAAKK